jgi:hypothetical protein
MSTLIGELQKTNQFVTKVEITDYEGKQYLDVRKYFKNNAGEFSPMRKGIMLPIAILSDFINLLERAEAQLAVHDKDNH